MPPCRTRVAVAVVAVAMLVAAGGERARGAGPEAPEDVLRRYLAALKDERFEDAYPLISKAMRQGRDKEVYVKESKAFMAFADVKIFEFTVGTAKVEQDKALVPNLLESQDRLANTLGLTEYELYTLVREDGGWKVDSQILLEPQNVSKWFPGKAPKAGNPPSD